MSGEFRICAKLEIRFEKYSFIDGEPILNFVLGNLK